MEAIIYLKTSFLPSFLSSCSSGINSCEWSIIYHSLSHLTSALWNVDLLKIENWKFAKLLFSENCRSSDFSVSLQLYKRLNGCKWSAKWRGDSYLHLGLVYDSFAFTLTGFLCKLLYFVLMILFSSSSFTLIRTHAGIFYKHYQAGAVKID